MISSLFRSMRVLALVGMAAALGCKKADPPAPTYGEFTVAGRTGTFARSLSQNTTGLYAFTLRGLTDSAKGQAYGELVVRFLARPTKAGTIGLGDSAVVEYSYNTLNPPSTELRTYDRTTDRIEVQINNGRLRLTLNNFGQTSGAQPASALTATLQER